MLIDNNIKLNPGETLESRTTLGMFIIIVFIVTIIFIFSGNPSSSSYSDSNSYQQRYDNEKAQTSRDIRKAIDEAKYQEWKNK